MSSTMTIRLEDGIKNRLDQLANVTQRSKSFLAAEALAAYVDTNEWQLSEIQAALTEAQAQVYATDQDMADLALKCRYPVVKWLRPRAKPATMKPLTSHKTTPPQPVGWWRGCSSSVARAAAG
jgi:predicted transcriptional regulator